MSSPDKGPDELLTIILTGIRDAEAVLDSMSNEYPLGRFRMMAKRSLDEAVTAACALHRMKTGISA